VATNTPEGGSSRRREGKCHHCGKEGHWVRECCIEKREEAATATAENQSGQAAQANSSTSTKPKNKPVGPTNTSEDDSDSDGFCMADENVARRYPHCAEPDPLMGESEDDKLDEWESFHAETWGAEDEP